MKAAMMSTGQRTFAGLVGLLPVAVPFAALGQTPPPTLERTVLPMPEPKRQTYSEIDARKAKMPPRFDVKEACWGGCPKHRFAVTPDGEPGLHYLCAGYRKFFRHVRKYLRAMTTLIENDLPVIPVSRNKDWNLITRTILPAITQPGFVAGQGSTSGLGDIQFSAFASPSNGAGLIWGAGAIVQAPMHSNDRLGNDRWGWGRRRSC